MSRHLLSSLSVLSFFPFVSRCLIGSIACDFSDFNHMPVPTTENHTSDARALQACGIGCPLCAKRLVHRRTAEKRSRRRGGTRFSGHPPAVAARSLAASCPAALRTTTCAAAACPLNFHGCSPSLSTAPLPCHLPLRAECPRWARPYVCAAASATPGALSLRLASLAARRHCVASPSHRPLGHQNGTSPSAPRDPPAHSVSRRFSSSRCPLTVLELILAGRVGCTMPQLLP